MDEEDAGNKARLQSAKPHSFAVYANYWFVSRKEKKDYHKSQGTRMKGKKETATDVDRENICTVAIWKGDGSSA